MVDKKTLFLWLGLLGFLALIAVVLKFSPPKGPRIMINDQSIFVEVADTGEKRAQGLSDRPSLPRNKGMLFIFPEAGDYSFWMKEMRFNLDFVFINGEEVVSVVENVPFPKSDEEPQVVTPDNSCDKVLEVNQGVVKVLNVKVGDKVVFFP